MKKEMIQKIAELKGKIEVKVGQSVNVNVEAGKEEVRVSASTVCNFKHYLATHIMTPEQWEDGGYYIDYAVVMLSNLLRESLTRETNRPQVIGQDDDTCLACKYNPNIHPRCTSCHGGRWFTPRENY